jgi:hypothetical protein
VWLVYGDEFCKNSFSIFGTWTWRQLKWNIRLGRLYTFSTETDELKNWSVDCVLCCFEGTDHINWNTKYIFVFSFLILVFFFVAFVTEGSYWDNLPLRTRSLNFRHHFRRNAIYGDSNRRGINYLGVYLSGNPGTNTLTIILLISVIGTMQIKR